mmetsp:Transcript_57113/g.139202  ORF Transcript_57113/g.139202 Transcript_57113/m.139202 type:complete len:98 (+) Transcript_57113:290-583(+)
MLCVGFLCLQPREELKNSSSRERKEEEAENSVRCGRSYLSGYAQQHCVALRCDAMHIAIYYTWYLAKLSLFFSTTATTIIVKRKLVNHITITLRWCF